MPTFPWSRPGFWLTAAFLLVLLLCGCRRERPPVAVVLVPLSPTPERTVATPAGPAAVQAGGSGAVRAPAANPTGPTPTTGPTAVPSPTRGPGVYTIQPGDTLTSIAARFGVTVDDLMAENGISDPNTIYVGQQLRLPGPVEAPEGPVTRLVPDSELVYSPAYREFDTAATIQHFGGFLASYTEEVEGEDLTGAQIVERVARRFSVGPRVLLALLEMQSGWVTQPAPVERDYPLGQREGNRAGLFLQLSWAANHLNEGYYGKLLGRYEAMRFQTGERLRFAAGLNPGSAALQNVLAPINTPESWQRAIGPDGFSAVYRRLFGDPWAHPIEPLVPAGLAQPALRLPWSSGEIWYYTGGPHGGWGEGSARAAIDFVPPTNAGCGVAPEWALAVSDGIIARSENGEVVLDLDGDGFLGTGWTILYMHVASEGRVPVGARVRTGDRIGHPSCEGGFSNATHLHLARRYNGQWMQADASPALVLSGWQAVAWERSYDGELVRGGRRVEACECRSDEKNGIAGE